MSQGIAEKFPAFAELSEEEQNERITTLLNFGFIWNPLYQKFENRFYNVDVAVPIALKPSAEVVKMVKTINKPMKSFAGVKEKVYHENALEKFISRWSYITLIIGPVIWIIGVILMALSSFNILGSMISITGSLLIYHQVTFQSMQSRIMTEAEMSSVWRNGKGRLVLLRNISMISSIALTFSYVDSPRNYLLIGLGLVLTLPVNYLVTTSLNKLWWCFSGIPTLEAHFNKIGEPKAPWN